MNIEQLIMAAERIDELAQKQNDRAVAWQQLAADARKPDADQSEIQRRRAVLDAPQVIDFGDAVAALRRALKARPSKTKQ